MNFMAETLLYPYRKNLLEMPEADVRLLFLNAENTPALKDVKSPVLVQPRYDKARTLIDAGHAVVDSPPDEKFDTVWVLPSKDKTETQYLLAQALRCAKNGGTIVAAAPNDAGGRRLPPLFEELGLAARTESKNKARIVFAPVHGYDRKQADLWFDQGKEQRVAETGVFSCAGLHGWDKVDAGSALLARHLPAGLHGHVADFGCGWGYLTLQALATAHKITQLTLADIDVRAIRIAARNIEEKYPAMDVKTLWTDLTTPDGRRGPYDAILLNPPFHDGTRAVPERGQAIIAAAAQALKPQGTLYLVANRHLPYEKTLHALFSHVELLADEDGFKAVACR